VKIAVIEGVEKTRDSRGSFLPLIPAAVLEVLEVAFNVPAPAPLAAHQVRHAAGVRLPVIANRPALRIGEPAGGTQTRFVKACASSDGAALTEAEAREVARRSWKTAIGLIGEPGPVLVTHWRTIQKRRGDCGLSNTQSGTTTHNSRR
jgi:hypothetical protein